MAVPDKWIVSRLRETTDEATRLVEAHQSHEAGRTLYEFIWSEFCDWYIEAVKVRLWRIARSVVPQTLA